MEVCEQSLEWGIVKHSHRKVLLNQIDCYCRARFGVGTTILAPLSGLRTGFPLISRYAVTGIAPCDLLHVTSWWPFKSRWCLDSSRWSPSWSSPVSRSWLVARYITCCIGVGHWLRWLSHEKLSDHFNMIANFELYGQWTMRSWSKKRRAIYP